MPRALIAVTPAPINRAHEYDYSADSRCRRRRRYFWPYEAARGFCHHDAIFCADAQDPGAVPPTRRVPGGDDAAPSGQEEARVRADAISTGLAYLRRIRQESSTVLMPSVALKRL